MATVADQCSEQTRARYPDTQGFVERDGVRVFWESYGAVTGRSSSCRRGRSSIRGCGSARSRTSRAGSAS
jgi:hypothetical protein